MAGNGDELGRLKDRISALETIVERLKVRLPAPAGITAPPKPPAWAAQTERTGMLYSGAPSPLSGAGSGLWGGYVKKVDERGNWRDPSNILRDARATSSPRRQASRFSDPPERLLISRLSSTPTGCSRSSPWPTFFVLI